MTDAELAELLLAVGVEPPANPELFDKSFDDLGIESLAQAELASRLDDRYGVDLEEWLEPETTPNEMRRQVAEKMKASTV
nr:hypothetical protein [Kibdelosporangium sp. MJ126-NF4]CTQ97199.1 hypothetical protein [Kibdelosporangium sp. MJ126-NF4]